jgi:hypothetical protein
MLVEKLQVGNLVMKESDFLVNLDRDGVPNERYFCELDCSGSGCTAFTECCRNRKKFRIIEKRWRIPRSVLRQFVMKNSFFFVLDIVRELCGK